MYVVYVMYVMYVVYVAATTSGHPASASKV